MRIQAYRNLHKSHKLYSVYSIRDKHSRKVIDWKTFFILENCKFHVSPAGRARVLRECKKNVHAWVEGDMILSGGDAMAVYKAFLSRYSGVCLEGITYNPYKYDQFQRASGGPAPDGCRVIFTPHGVSMIIKR